MKRRRTGTSRSNFYKRLKLSSPSPPPISGTSYTASSSSESSSDSSSESTLPSSTKHSDPTLSPESSLGTSPVLWETPSITTGENIVVFGLSGPEISVRPETPRADSEGSEYSNSVVTETDEESETELSANNDEEDSEELSFKDKLAHLIAEHNCTRDFTEDLLELLRKDGKMALPKSWKGLMKTPSDKIETREVESGEYYHIGIQESLCEFEETSFLSDLDQVEVYIGIDGCPLSKSTPLTMWPILLSFPSHQEISPILIGIYSGEKDPTKPDVFLRDFILEARDLQKNGVLVTKARVRKPFRIRAIVSDSKARPMLASVVGHTAANGCGFCDQVAKKDKGSNRLVFSIEKGNLRTDQTIRARLDTKHHKTQEETLIETLGLDMVESFPLCPMHLVHLGVVRALGVLWTTPKSKFFRLKPKDRTRLNVSHLQCAPFMPSEFARKLESTTYIGRWKATQCRQFLLYIGPTVLKHVLDQEHYEHFLLLSSAIRILSSEVLCTNAEMVEKADDMLQRFVQQYPKMYGHDQITFNVHNLLHLVDCVKIYGSLEKFSAFPFENFMQRIKKKVSVTSPILPQIVKRLQEERKLKAKPRKKKNQSTNKFKCTKKFLGCSFAYKSHLYNNVQYSVGDKNGCCVINKDQIVSIQGFGQCDDTFGIFGYIFQIREDFYKTPMKSSELGIHLVRELSTELQFFSMKEVSCKMVKIPFNDAFVVQPLIHDS